MKSIIRIGTRGSRLAMYQAELVKAKLAGQFPCVPVECVRIKTSGDMIRRGGVTPFETKRVYTREIEEALLKNEVDIAVHSAKDMAVDPPGGLVLAAALEREDPRDCLLAADGRKLAELPLGARVGTSSLRRKAQLLRHGPELVVEEMRGNIETRIRKLGEGVSDAIVLAYAGVKRLGLVNHVTEVFDEDWFYPAPGQGVIAVEARADDAEMLEMLRPVQHAASRKRLDCERAFLRRLEGGCQLPCGIATELADGVLRARGALFAIKDNEWAEGAENGPAKNPEAVGDALAVRILEHGGREILEKIRHESAKKK